MDGTYLGKITKAAFGIGGRDDAQFGLSLAFEFDSSGTNSFEGVWQERSDYAHWSIEDRAARLVEINWLILKTLQDAKKRNVSELPGTPVEVVIEGNMLKSWRVLTEVL